MEEPKFHLLNDFGVHKSNVKRNLDADYGKRDDDWSKRVRALLEKPTELYTLDEIADLIKALSSAHDDQVLETQATIRIRTGDRRLRFGNRNIRLNGKPR